MVFDKNPNTCASLRKRFGFKFENLQGPKYYKWSTQDILFHNFLCVLQVYKKTVNYKCLNERLCFYNSISLNRIK